MVHTSILQSGGEQCGVNLSREQCPAEHWGCGEGLISAGCVSGGCTMARGGRENRTLPKASVAQNEKYRLKGAKSNMGQQASGISL